MKKLNFASAFRSLAMAGLVVSGGHSAALAQAAAPSAGTAQAAPSAKFQPAHIDAAIEVLKLSGMARSIDIIVPQMIDGARRMFTTSRPELTADVEKTLKNLEPDWQEQNNIAMRIAAEAFAERLTEAELKQLQTFYSSDVGKKFVSVQPALLPDMMRNLDTFTGRLSVVVIEKIREDFKKRNVPF